MVEEVSFWKRRSFWKAAVKVAVIVGGGTGLTAIFATDQGSEVAVNVIMAIVGLF